MRRPHSNAIPLSVSVAATAVLMAALAVSAQNRFQGPVLPGDGKQPPHSDTRLSVHTLVREDIFAGAIANDMKRFARGEKNIDRLLADRPDEKGNLLAWKGMARLTRAARAHEAGNTAEYRRLFREGEALIAQAAAGRTGNGGVLAITGGGYAMIADLLPKSDRAGAWQKSYAAYHALMQQQGAILANLPEHHRGEVLGGLAISALRTGHAAESAQAIDKMLALLPNTAYGAAAKSWKQKPGGPARTILCIGCHEPGRLQPSLAALSKK